MALSVAGVRARRVAARQGRVRSQLKGAASTRKLLRQLPPAAKDRMGDVLAGAGVELVEQMRADVPVRTGALRAGLDSKLLKSSLRLRVGFIGKSVNRRLFYGRIIEFGRKAQTVTIKHGPRAGARMRVRAMAGRPFIFKGRLELRGRFRRDLNQFWDNTLSLASAGVGND